MAKNGQFTVASKLILTFILLVISTMCFANPNTLSAQNNPLITNTQSLKQPLVIPPAPEMSAKAYILIDNETGKIIAEKNADLRVPPASLTKMMTLYIISESLQNGTLNIDETVKISKKAWKTGGSKMFVRDGAEVKVSDLIQGIVVQSGNDACVAMAEHIAGGENAFAALMNQSAEKLGMTNSHFTDSTGLPHKNHYSTPRDMAILARALIRDFPDNYHWYAQKWFTYNKIKQINRNRLLWRYQFADGIKTGHTKEAGYCLVSSAEKDDMRLISAVMGTKSEEARANDSQRLLTYGFRFFDSEKLYSAGKMIDTVRVYKGKEKTIPIGLKEDLSILIPRGQFDKVITEVVVQTPIAAPIKKGDKLGKVTVTLNGDTFSEQVIIALEDDPKGSIFTRFLDSFALTWTHWFG